MQLLQPMLVVMEVITGLHNLPQAVELHLTRMHGLTVRQLHLSAAFLREHLL